MAAQFSAATNRPVSTPMIVATTARRLSGIWVMGRRWGMGVPLLWKLHPAYRRPTPSPSSPTSAPGVAGSCRELPGVIPLTNPPRCNPGHGGVGKSLPCGEAIETTRAPMGAGGLTEAMSTENFVSNQIFINGWVDGTSERSTTTLNPFNGEEVATIRNASPEDVDKAYATAAEVQKEWAAVPPVTKARILNKAAQFIEDNRDAIVELIRRESGSTALKANIEAGLAMASLREAATFPARITGQILPSNTPGKSNYVFREALGVVGRAHV